MSFENGAPLIQRPREFSAICFGEKLGDGSFRRIDEFENVNKAIIRKPVPQAGENCVRARVVDVMKKAVDENEVEFGIGDVILSGDIDDEKVAFVFLFGAFDVVGMDVEPQVAVVCKKRCICTWGAAHVQNSTRSRQIGLPQNRSEFLANEWRLPKRINGCSSRSESLSFIWAKAPEPQTCSAMYVEAGPSGL